MSAAGEAWGVEYGFAQEQDFQQVVNLCTKNDYGGMDYMAATFHHWLQEPGRLIFIAKLKDTVAVLSLCCEATDFGPFIAELQSRLPLQSPSSPCCPFTLNQQQVETLILTDHVVSNLLPGKTIINNWEPLKPMEANLEVLRRRKLTWIADDEFEPNALSLCSPSYAVPYRHDALRICINIFGRNLASVCAVFVAQLEALLPSLRGYLIIGVFVDPTVWPGLQQFCHNNANVCFFRDYYQSTMLEADL